VFLKVYENKLANLQLEVKILIVFCVLVLVSNFFAILGSRHKVVIVIPYGYTGEVSTSSPGVSYLSAMGTLIANLYENVSPADVDSRYATLLKLASPGFYPEFKKELLDNAREIKQKDITSTFYIKNVAVDLKHRVIKVTGTGYFFTGPSQVASSEKSLFIYYKYVYGTFQITGLTEKQGNSE